MFFSGSGCPKNDGGWASTWGAYCISRGSDLGRREEGKDRVMEDRRCGGRR